MTVVLVRRLFTFGMDHRTSDGESLFKRFVVIEAPTRETARAVMFAYRGSRWAFDYPATRQSEMEARGDQEIALCDVWLPAVMHG